MVEEPRTHATVGLKGAPAAFFWGYSSQWLIPMLAPNALYTSRNSRLQRKMRNQLELTR